MIALEFLQHAARWLGILFILCYAYQFLYIPVALAPKKKKPLQAPLRRYAILISARNEESVIAQLLDSISQQDYPADLIVPFVVADNCTDATARVARDAGAVVYERFNKQQVGKGYALNYLIQQIRDAWGDEYFDGYFVFDADNLVDPNFVSEMNRTFDRGYDAVTCYRNSKNFGSNWISAGYSIWFLREARFLNFPRTLLGTNCHVSGTGFLVSAQVIRDNGGWPFHLLTEDIQFSVDGAIKGRRIGYCDKAVVYDEQPTTFRQSWDQRLRWSKGFYQVDRRYALPLLRGCFRGGRRGLSCYDMLATVAPGMLLTVLLLLFNGGILAACFTQPPYWAQRIVDVTLGFIASNLWNFYVGLLAYGMLTVASEWRHIDAAPMQKIGYVFTFPIFMFTYIPISMVALVRRVEWKPIYHTATKKLHEPS